MNIDPKLLKERISKLGSFKVLNIVSTDSYALEKVFLDSGILRRSSFGHCSGWDNFYYDNTSQRWDINVPPRNTYLLEISKTLLASEVISFLKGTVTTDKDNTFKFCIGDRVKMIVGGRQWCDEHINILTSSCRTYNDSRESVITKRAIVSDSTTSVNIYRTDRYGNWLTEDGLELIKPSVVTEEPISPLPKVSTNTQHVTEKDKDLFKKYNISDVYDWVNPGVFVEYENRAHEVLGFDKLHNDLLIHIAGRDGNNRPTYDRHGNSINTNEILKYSVYFSKIKKLSTNVLIEKEYTTSSEDLFETFNIPLQYHWIKPGSIVRRKENLKEYEVIGFQIFHDRLFIHVRWDTLFNTYTTVDRWNNIIPTDGFKYALAFSDVEPIPLVTDKPPLTTILNSSIDNGVIGDCSSNTEVYQTLDLKKLENLIENLSSSSINIQTEPVVTKKTKRNKVTLVKMEEPI